MKKIHYSARVIIFSSNYYIEQQLNNAMKRNVILKYLRGETSPEERIKMLRWIEEDPAHLEEYKYLRIIFDANL